MANPQTGESSSVNPHGPDQHEMEHRRAPQTPILETEIGPTHNIVVYSTRRRRISIDWTSSGKLRRIVVDSERVRELADLLHDAADQLEDQQ